MGTLSYTDLVKACSAGGSSVLTSITELEAAVGQHGSVAPAKFVNRSEPVFAFEDRFIDGESKRTVLIDSKQSQLNRAEAALMQAINEGNETLNRIPRIEVSYNDSKVFSDLELPHRFTDGHIRAGSIDGKPTTENDLYISARNSTPRNMKPLLNLAPSALIFGGWDASRKSDQVKLRSALVGEIIGVLANQNRAESYSRRGGARVDPVAASVKMTGTDLKETALVQSHELSQKTRSKLDNQVKKAKKGETVSASPLGLGAIPPSLESLGGVACQRIIRSWALSFAALRQLRFGGTAEQDIAARALLAALGLAAMARAESELNIRANCDLVEQGKPVVTLDLRYGEKRELEPISVEAADELLKEAIAKASACGISDWEGQILHVTGNPVVLRGATEDDAEAE